MSKYNYKKQNTRQNKRKNKHKNRFNNTNRNMNGQKNSRNIEIDESYYFYSRPDATMSVLGTDICIYGVLGDVRYPDPRHYLQPFIEAYGEVSGDFESLKFNYQNRYRIDGVGEHIYTYNPESQRLTFANVTVTGVPKCMLAEAIEILSPSASKYFWIKGDYNDVLESLDMTRIFDWDGWTCSYNPKTQILQTCNLEENGKMYLTGVSEDMLDFALDGITLISDAYSYMFGDCGFIYGDYSIISGFCKALRISANVNLLERLYFQENNKTAIG